MMIKVSLKVDFMLNGRTILGLRLDFIYLFLSFCSKVVFYILFWIPFSFYKNFLKRLFFFPALFQDQYDRMPSYIESKLLPFQRDGVRYFSSLDYCYWIGID